MRRRLAPVASRIAISRRRPTPRASSRLATFEQAIHKQRRDDHQRDDRDQQELDALLG